MFSKNTMLSESASKSNSVTIKHFQSAYLPFRKTGCSYSESVETVRCRSKLQANDKHYLIKIAIYEVPDKNTEQYLIEKFAHFKIDSNPTKEEFSVFGLYVKAVANKLFLSKDLFHLLAIQV
jgi:hypothetical protein